MTETTTPTPAERNRTLVLDAFAEFAASRDIEVLRELIAEDFVEHSPGNPSGRDAFIEFMATSPFATSRLDLRRVVADDTHVVLHYLMVAPGEARGTAVVDILRMDGAKIVEHWDVKEPVPDPAQTPNGMV